MATRFQPKPKLTYERLREVLRYDRRTGIFYWRVTHHRIVAGDIAGCLSRSTRYWIITVDQKHYARSRLAWFYVHREWPEELDHRDMVRHHDWISNLRLASQTQNNANRRAYRNNQAGFKGIYLWAGRYRAMIRKDRRGIHIGCYDTPEEAHRAYCIKARELFGDFANGGT